MSHEENIRVRSVGTPTSAAHAPISRLRLQEAESFPIVVHSHLRWSFVWQRPQQTHSRLARTHRMLFLEEAVPLEAGENPHLKVREVAPNLLVAQPAIAEEPGESFESREAKVLSVLREALAGPLGRRFARAAHWLYTPLMEPQIALFRQPRAILYDCMDELASFAFAPPQLARREKRLLAKADVVFTGGHELYLAKRSLHSHVHPFGCGVDFEHFHRVASGLPEAADLAKIPPPRLGYIGVIDERLDYELIGRLAAENPESSVVMIGPVVKVDPAALPKASNIHYLGPRDYLALPYYLAGFDVCLMPFALNEASRYINPTKTLEYLASGKPVLSTPVRDVVRQFAGVVTVASPAAFPGAARAVLGGAGPDPAQGLEVARKASWEATVRRMEQLLEQAIARRENRWMPSSLREAREASA